MNTIGGSPSPNFDALVDFVQQSYDQLEANLADTQNVGGDQSYRDQQKQLVSELDQAVRDAQAQKAPPMEKLLRDVRGAVSISTPDAKPDPKLADGFEAQGQRLTSDQFGDAPAFKLPDVFGKALSFLRGALDGKPASTTVKTPAPATTTSTSTTPSTFVERRINERDPRVEAFVSRYFGDQFETATPKLPQQAVLQSLPTAEKQKFLQLPKEEQAFLLNLDPKQQPAYAQMPREEQVFFRSMKPSERGQYLAMTPDERQFFRNLDPTERANYLAVHPEQREVIRGQGEDGRKLLQPQTAQQAALANKEPVDVARELSTDVLQLFGHDVTGQSPDLKGKTADLQEKTRTLLMNFLQAQPGNVSAARVSTMRALLETPEFQQKLLSDVESRLTQKDSSRGAEGTQSYAAHFKKIRPLLLDHAQKLLRPDTDREGLLSGLEQAVELSAEFAAQNPPRRRDLRVSQNLQFRYITG